MALLIVSQIMGVMLIMNGLSNMEFDPQTGAFMVESIKSASIFGAAGSMKIPHALSLHAKVCSILGLDPAEPKWHLAATEAASVEGVEFDSILSGWVEDRTVQEVEEIMNASQVACCPIMSARDMAENPHYRARELHIEWDDVQLGRKVKGVGFTPKFSETPGKVWRGSVSLGHDNDLVYGHYLGLRPDELEELRETGAI